MIKRKFWKQIGKWHLFILQGKTWKYLLLMIKIELLRKIYNFGKLVFPNIFQFDFGKLVITNNSLILWKTFLMVLMVILTNMIFKILYNEMCQHMKIDIRKICIIQWISIFQIAEAWGYKIFHWLKICSKCKIDQWILM